MDSSNTFNIPLEGFIDVGHIFWAGVWAVSVHLFLHVMKKYKHKLHQAHFISHFLLSLSIAWIGLVLLRMRLLTPSMKKRFAFFIIAVPIWYFLLKGPSQYQERLCQKCMKG